MTTMELEMTRGTLTELGGMLHQPQEDNAYLNKPNDLVEKVKPSAKYILYFICVNKPRSAGFSLERLL